MTVPLEIAKSPDARARKAAEARLLALGFVEGEDGAWAGEVVSATGERKPVTVVLPALFPYQLPVIRLLRSHGDRALAHVAQNGVLCIAPSNVLLDVDRPESLIEDALARAQNILFPPDARTHASDLAREFNAYWVPRDAPDVAFICEVTGNAGACVLAELQGCSAKYLFAPDKSAASAWVESIGGLVISVKPAYFVPLERLPPPPPFDAILSLREMRHLISAHTNKETNDGFTAWLRTTGVPSYVVLAAPTKDGGPVVFAASLPAPSAEQVKKAANGFRKGHVPVALVVSHANSEPIRRLDLARFDATYLVERGGGATHLLTKRIAVIGCGSVGSHVAESLAGSGVGELRLFDLELMAGDNVHRHALGVSRVGQGKAAALAEALRRRFPHLVITATQGNILSTLAEAPAEICECDLIAVALGDGTIERRLNALFPKDLHRVHVWLEPMGLGGHVLATGFPNKQGCFECLFRRDDVHGLTDMASLVESGQVFSRNLGGCAGTFTPYGMLDAQHAAIEMCRICLDILLGVHASPLLKTWVTSRRAFEAGGHRLSRRGGQIGEGQVLFVTDFCRPDCPVCGGAEV